MAERIGTPTMANPARIEAHNDVVRALEALRARPGKTLAWESIEYAVRTGALQAELLVPAKDGAK